MITPKFRCLKNRQEISLRAGPELYPSFQKLRDKAREKWYLVRFELYPDGKFDIEYDYNPPQKDKPV